MLLVATALALDIDPATVDRLAAEVRGQVETVAGRRLLHLPAAEVLAAADPDLQGALPEDFSTLIGVVYLRDRERLVVVSDRLGERWDAPVLEGLLRCEVARALTLALHHQYLPPLETTHPVREGHAALVARRACAGSTTPDVVATFDLATASALEGESLGVAPVAVGRRWVARLEADEGREAVWTALTAPPPVEALAERAEELRSDPWEVDDAVAAVGDVLSDLHGQGSRYWPTPLGLLSVFGSLDVDVVASPLLPPTLDARTWLWQDERLEVWVVAAQLADDLAPDWLRANFPPWVDGRQRFHNPEQQARGRIDRGGGVDEAGHAFAVLRVHGRYGGRSFHEVWLSRGDQLFFIRATGGRWRPSQVDTGPMFLAATIPPTSPGARLRREAARALFDRVPAEAPVDAPPDWRWRLEHARLGTDQQRADALLAALDEMTVEEVLTRVDEARALAVLARRPELETRVLDRIGMANLPDRVRFDLARDRLARREWDAALGLLDGITPGGGVSGGELLDLRVILSVERGGWAEARELALRPESLHSTRLWLVTRALLGQRPELAAEVHRAACAALPEEERPGCEALLR